MRRAGVALYAHLVWATWDRLPLLQGETARQVYRAIGAKCDELGVEIVALGGIEDHVHLLASMPATLSVADLVKHVKGASSHLIASQRRDEIDGFFKWQGAYGACTVSPSALGEVARYITNQRAHHAAGSLLAELEPLPSLPKEANG
ncbi:MAG TPA: IS200/IS605 family transposase [Ktedonobacterales bacterium]|nr:IS200/IS605 family transposase [Ktedonobacterales bacterium]